MTNDAIDKFNLAKSIILASTSLRLFGCLFYKFNITLNDSTNPEFTAIAFATKNQNNKLTFNISISKLFVNSLKNANELVYVILHEIIHILNKHGSRGATASSGELFNIAADHVINTSLDSDIKNGSLKGLKSPDSRIIITALINKNLSTEEVYSYLMDHATITKHKFQINTNPNNNDQSSQDGNQPSSQNDDQSSNTIEITKVHVKMDDGQEFVFYQDLSMNGQEIETEENNIQDDARRILNSPIFESERKKGTNSSKTMELIEEAIKVEIPWDQLLESVIKTNITERSENKSWYRVNKRMYPYNMILPYNDVEETYETLWVFIDTSGSITTYELKKAVYIIKASMYHFKRVIKIDHDVRCYDEFKHVYDNSTIDNFQNDIKVAFTGRGGTSHKYVYDYIEQAFEDSITNDPELQIPGLILFITDYESDIESIHNKYKWPKEIPYKYIITSNKKFDVSPEVDKNPVWILNEK